MTRIVNVGRFYAWSPKLLETIRDIREGRLSHSPHEPAVASPLDSPRGAYFILDGHHRIVEAILAGRRSFRVTVHLPRLDRTGGAYRHVLEAKVRLVDVLGRRRTR